MEKTGSTKWNESWQEEESLYIERGPTMTLAYAFHQGLVLTKTRQSFFGFYELLARRDDGEFREFFCM